MHVLGIVISVLIVSGMLSSIGLVIYNQIQKIRGKDKKSQKTKQVTKKGGE